LSEVGGARVELRDVSKRFGATQALRNVSVTIEPGRVHALVGENGAGKSTLGKIIGGVYVLDSGQMSVDGTDATRWDPPSALRAGIATIQQELSLVPAQTVAENVFLGIEQSRFGILQGSVLDRYDRLEESVGFEIPGDVTVQSLRLADQQKVEILRALARNARLIVLDEPTSSLSRDESDRLLDLMRGLRDEGRTLVYVSHFLDEVLSVADTVTVMRDGQVVRTGPAQDETKDSLIEGMLGQNLEGSFPTLPPVPDGSPVVFEAEGLAGEVPQNIDLAVYKGEIVGLAGLVGSGRTELARLIAGADRVTSGEMRLDGQPLPPLSSRQAIDRGIVMLPEDRQSLGLVLTQNLRENVTLPRLKSFRQAGRILQKAERLSVAGVIKRLGIIPARVDGELRVYSGGNQQKALFAKWTMEQPRLIVLDEPTRGVDIGAKQGIYDAIIEVAAAGSAIILISSELEEVLHMSHRVAVMSGGRIVACGDSDELTVDEVLEHLFKGAESGMNPV